MLVIGVAPVLPGHDVKGALVGSPGWNPPGLRADQEIEPRWGRGLSGQPAMPRVQLDGLLLQLVQQVPRAKV